MKNFSISALRTGGKGTSSGGGTPTMKSGSPQSPVRYVRETTNNEYVKQPMIMLNNY